MAKNIARLAVAATAIGGGLVAAKKMRARRASQTDSPAVPEDLSALTEDIVAAADAPTADTVTPAGGRSHLQT